MPRRSPWLALTAALPACVPPEGRDEGLLQAEKRNVASPLPLVEADGASRR